MSHDAAIYALAPSIFMLGACSGSSTPSCDQSVAILVAPEDGCATIEVVADDAGHCAYTDANGETLQEFSGTWLRLTHPRDREARLVVRTVSVVERCTEDGPSCPYARLTTGGAAACECRLHELDNLPLPFDEPFEWPLHGGGEQQVLLSPAGAVFEVSVCVGNGDAFPVCATNDLGEPVCPGNLDRFGDDAFCACLPSCEDDDDCPLPRSGSVTPRCDSGLDRCILPCTPTDACPDGQEGVEEPHWTEAEAVCMARY